MTCSYITYILYFSFNKNKNTKLHMLTKASNDKTTKMN